MLLTNILHFLLIPHKIAFFLRKSNVGTTGLLGELGFEGLRGHNLRLHDFHVWRFTALPRTLRARLVASLAKEKNLNHLWLKSPLEPQQNCG